MYFRTLFSVSTLKQLPAIFPPSESSKMLLLLLLHAWYFCHSCHKCWRVFLKCSVAHSLNDKTMFLTVDIPNPKSAQLSPQVRYWLNDREQTSNVWTRYNSLYISLKYGYYLNLHVLTLPNELSDLEKSSFVLWYKQLSAWLISHCVCVQLLVMSEYQSLTLFWSS